MKKLLLLSGIALSACTTAERVTDPVASLRPYYATLDAPLPVAPPGVALDDSSAITRIAFGSCDQQDRPQGVWNVIAAADPDLFLMIGDNVYGDVASTGAAELPQLSAAYARLSERQEFRVFRARVPMLAVWDDHDYGFNDAGGSFAFKERAEDIFEAYWGSSAAVRARPGVHDSVIAGPDGRRVQIIMLDTRFFRSDLKRAPYQDPPPKLGWSLPTDDPAATILGDAQWAWLAAELEKPADLRLIVSSIQIETDAHGFEKWGNFPRERERLYRLLADKRVGNAVLLSGDRHQGAIYKAAVPGVPRPLWEITASSLNLAFLKDDGVDREPDPIRTDGMFSAENFGLLEIDWERRSVALKLKRSDGTGLAERAVEF